MARLTNSDTKEVKDNVTIKEAVDKLSAYENLEELGFLVDRNDFSLYRLCTGKVDKNGKVICQGDILENKEGLRLEVRYGTFAMYCPVDDCMMENVGFYVVTDGYYEDMPLGPAEEYATIVGNIYKNPELKVNEKYRYPAEFGNRQ